MEPRLKMLNSDASNQSSAQVNGGRKICSNDAEKCGYNDILTR